MTTTPDIGLPLVASQQAQPEITHNEAILLLQAMLQGVLSLGDTTPPADPEEGDSYVVGESATGDWKGKDNKIAFYYGSSWRFVPDVDSDGSDIEMGERHAGLRVWVRDEGALYVWASTGSPPTMAWTQLASL